MIIFIPVCRLSECRAFYELRNVSSDVTLDRRAIGDPVRRRSPPPVVGGPGRGCALLAIGFSGTWHSDSTSRSLSRRWMVSIAHKVPMYIVLLARRILNSHWAKTVTGTTPIGPSIEAHLYP